MSGTTKQGVFNVRRLNQTERRLLETVKSGGSYFVAKNTCTHSQRKANAAAKCELAGLIREVLPGSQYSTRCYVGVPEMIAKAEGK